MKTGKITALASVFLSAILGGVAIATPALAQNNPNAISWTVYQSYLGHVGNDVPLRIGQSDFGDEDGFGVRHIVGQHGVIPPAFDIQETIGNGGNCESGLFDDRVRCFNDETLLFVVYSTHADSRSGDGRPFGIITAFYTLPCFVESAVPSCMGDGTNTDTDLWRPTPYKHDFSGDGKTDIIGLHGPSQDLYLYKGNGTGGLQPGSTVFSENWGNFEMIFSPGDFSGDGKADIIGLHGPSQDLYLYKGNGTGGLQPGSTVFSENWGNFEMIF